MLNDTADTQLSGAPEPTENTSEAESGTQAPDASTPAKVEPGSGVDASVKPARKSGAGTKTKKTRNRKTRPSRPDAEAKPARAARPRKVADRTAASTSIADLSSIAMLVLCSSVARLLERTNLHFKAKQVPSRLDDGEFSYYTSVEGDVIRLHRAPRVSRANRIPLKINQINAERATLLNHIDAEKSQIEALSNDIERIKLLLKTEPLHKEREKLPYLEDRKAERKQVLDELSKEEKRFEAKIHALEEETNEARVIFESRLRDVQFTVRRT